VEASATREGREREEAMERRTSKGREEQETGLEVRDEGEKSSVLEEEEEGDESTKEGGGGGAEEDPRGKLEMG
jgi:hypothetical protein